MPWRLTLTLLLAASAAAQAPDAARTVVLKPAEQKKDVPFGIPVGGACTERAPRA